MLAGFDKKSGEMIWREFRNYKTPVENDNGYSTPILFDNAGKKALLLWGALAPAPAWSAAGNLALALGLAGWFLTLLRPLQRP